jgi:hypothetical protein
MAFADHRKHWYFHLRATQDACCDAFRQALTARAGAFKSNFEVEGVTVLQMRMGSIWSARSWASAALRKSWIRRAMLAHAAPKLPLPLRPPSRQENSIATCG